jgi:hypothetical protein
VVEELMAVMFTVAGVAKAEVIITTSALLLLFSHCHHYFPLIFLLLICHVKWSLCPHSMAGPRVADEGTASSYGG